MRETIKHFFWRHPLSFMLWVAAVVFLVIEASTYVAKTRFMAECKADGRKAYECEALWGAAQGGPDYYVLPR